MASRLAMRTGLPVFNLEYPLAPEAPFPAAYEASVRACAWLAEQGIERLAVGGDSAGGGLTLASIAHFVQAPALDNAPQILGCVVFSPWTDLSVSGATVDLPDPIFQPDRVKAFALRYLNGNNPEDPRASPFVQVPVGMPPIYIQVGTDELLLDDSLRYAKAAAASGATVKLDIWEGMHHVFQHAVDELGSSRRAMDSAGEFFISLFVNSQTAPHG